MGGNGSSRHVSFDPAYDEEQGVTFVKGIRVSVLDNDKLMEKCFLFPLLSNFNYIICVVFYLCVLNNTSLLQRSLLPLQELQ